jgi:hypothetical protein
MLRVHASNRNLRVSDASCIVADQIAVNLARIGSVWESSVLLAALSGVLALFGRILLNIDWGVTSYTAVRCF